MGKVFAGVLMNQAGDCKHYYGAHYRCCDNGRPLAAQEVEATHQRHSCGHEEEAEIGDEEVGGSLHVAWFDNAELKGHCEEQHPDDARRHRHSCGPDNEFAHGEKHKDDGKLKYNHFC